MNVSHSVRMLRNFGIYLIWTKRYYLCMEMKADLHIKMCLAPKIQSIFDQMQM